jgi:hypothetical protein
MISSSYEAEQLAARLACAVFDIDQDQADQLLTDATGSALLCLLANAAAKMAQFDDGIAVRYEHKQLLLRRAIRVSRDWWAVPHAYGDYADTVVYVETPFARFSFHCRRADPYLADLLERAPSSERGWSGMSLQPYAGQLALGYLAGAPTAVAVIERYAQ